jgi:TonB family protein
MVSLGSELPARASADGNRKAAAKSLAEEIERAQFQKIYVADFLDASGARTEKGCFFASSFSTLLSKESSKFEVVNRIKAQKELNELQISALDLARPELLSKAAAALGVDAILFGTVAISGKDAKLLFSLRETSSSKEVRSVEYHERLKPAFESSFPAAIGANDHFYYFPSMDGVAPPKCVFCPDPEYTDEARRNKIEGNVMLSVSIDEKGTIRDVRVVQDPGYGLAQRSIDAMKKWRMEPSHDPDGNPVPSRVIIETTFRLLH